MIYSTRKKREKKQRKKIFFLKSRTRNLFDFLEGRKHRSIYFSPWFLQFFFPFSVRLICLLSFQVLLLFSIEKQLHIAHHKSCGKSELFNARMRLTFLETQRNSFPLLFYWSTARNNLYSVPVKIWSGFPLGKKVEIYRQRFPDWLNIIYCWDVNKSILLKVLIC